MRHITQVIQNQYFIIMMNPRRGLMALTTCICWLMIAEEKELITRLLMITVMMVIEVEMGILAFEVIERSSSVGFFLSN